MSNPNEPAYPTDQQETVYQYDSARLCHPPQIFMAARGGMTIRQQFVMAAMQGLCANPGINNIEAIASQASRIADAALAEEARTRSKA